MNTVVDPGIKFFNYAIVSFCNASFFLQMSLGEELNK